MAYGTWFWCFSGISGEDNEAFRMIDGANKKKVDDSRYAYEVLLKWWITKQIPKELEAVMIMKDFWWTYQEFLEQPTELIEIYKVMKHLEAKQQKNEKGRN